MSNFKLKRAEHYRRFRLPGTFADAVQVQLPPMLELPSQKQADQEGAVLELRQRVPVPIGKILRRG